MTQEIKKPLESYTKLSRAFIKKDTISSKLKENSCASYKKPQIFRASNDNC